MKKIMLRLACFVLSLVMLVGVTACGGGKEDETVDTVDTLIPMDGPTSKVPNDLNFGGEEEVNILAHKSYFEELEPENHTAIIDAAVIKRNLLVEERLGIKLNFLFREENFAGPYQETIRSMILGGDSGIDIIQSHAYYTAKLASEGLFFNFNTKDDKNYISPELDWYNQSFVKNTAYRDKLYFLVGDITLGATDRAPVVFFNEDGLEDWHIEDDIYQKAIDGEWTIEYMKTLIKNVYEEQDNVEGKTKGDYFGLYFNGGSMCIDAMISAVGINITKTDANGDITMAWGTTKDVMGFQAIYKLMYETDGVFTGTIADNTYRGETSQYFSEDAFFERRALFATGMLCAAKNFALDPDLHFGMLPLPKMSAEDEYRTTPQDAFSIITMPHNVGSRLEIATATLETLSQYSYAIVRPVYHDTAYKIRYASGENTALLFDTVIDSIYYDFGTFYSNAMGNPVHHLRNKLTGTGTTLGSNLMSVTAQYGSSSKMHLKELLEAFDKLD